MDAESSALPAALLADAAWVRTLARALVADAAVAEDLAQETMLAALERGGGESSLPRPWLAAVLRNLARRAHRARARREERERAAARAEVLPSAHELVERAEGLRRLVALVLALQEPYRSTVLLRYVEELSPSDIAARQRVPVATVKTRLARALAQLRETAGARARDERPLWLVALAGADALPRGSLLAGGLLVGMKVQHYVLVAIAVLCIAGLGVYTARSLAPAAENAAALPDSPAPARGSSGASSSSSQPIAEGAAERSVDQPPQPRSKLAVGEESKIAGIVVDRLGLPIAGAELALWFDPSASYWTSLQLERELVERAETDAGGRFAFAVPAGRPHELEVRAEGFAPVLRTDCIAGQELRIELDRAARLRGSVVSENDESPVAEAMVRVFHGEWTVDIPVDASGAFALDEIVPGEIGLLALPQRFAIGRYQRFDVEPGGLLDVRLSVRAGLAVSGRVTDARTGAPIAGALVTAQHTGSKRTLTDAGGRYSLEGVEPERPAELIARAPGFASAHVVVDPRRASETDFTLESGFAVIGRVLLPSGEPAAGATVLAWSQSPTFGPVPEEAATRSASDGSFRIEDLRRELEGWLLVLARESGIGLFALPRSAEDPTDLGLLRLERPALVAGRIVDATGAGASAYLQLAPSSGEPGAGAAIALRGCETRPDGSFALGELAPGRYMSRVVPPGGPAQESGLELAPGEARTGLVIQLQSGIAIRGAVVDQEGRPIPGVSVAATRADGDRTRPVSSSTTTDERGWFELDGLAAGAHTLSIRRSEPWSFEGITASLAPVWIAGVEPGSAPLEIGLKRLDRRIAGTVVDAAGVPVPSAYVWVERGAQRPCDGVLCDDLGHFELAVEDAGPLELAARRTQHLSEAKGGLSSPEVLIGRHIAPAEQGEARSRGVLPRVRDVVLRLTR